MEFDDSILGPSVWFFLCDYVKNLVEGEKLKTAKLFNHLRSNSFYKRIDPLNRIFNHCFYPPLFLTILTVNAPTMAAKRRKQRRQDNKSVPPPAVAAPSPNRPKEAPATNIPDDPTNINGPSNIPQITRLERCKLILDAVTETCIERVVDLTILLGKFFRGIRRGISLLDMVSYVVLIVATQSWLSLSLLQNVVYLFILSGIEFQFPFQILKKLLVKYKANLASDFRLLVLSCVCIAFVNDALMSNSHLPAEKRLKIYWNVFFAQMIMYGCIPFMNSFADIVNVGLAIISFARIAVEVAINCTTSNLFASINFLPEALVFHSVFLSILGTCLTYYEADKFLDKYMRVPSPPQLAA